MDAFIKIFNEKEFLDKIKTLRPSYLMIGEEISEAFSGKKNMKLLPNNFDSYSDYTTILYGTDIYTMPAPFPPDKIIFGVE